MKNSYAKVWKKVHGGSGLKHHKPIYGPKPRIQKFNIKFLASTYHIQNESLSYELKKFKNYLSFLYKHMHLSEIYFTLFHTIVIYIVISQ